MTCPGCGSKDSVVVYDTRRPQRASYRWPAWLECGNCGLVLAGQELHDARCDCAACERAKATAA